MATKRDVLVVRLAIKWKWLTPEQGEDVLFLKRKFGSKLTVEQIIRRRGYLDWEEIDQLAETANVTVGGRRARPLGSGESQPDAARPRSSINRVEDTAPKEPPPVPLPDELEDDEFRDEGKTVIAAMPDLVKRALAQAERSHSKPPQPAIPDDSTIISEAVVVEEDFDDDDVREPTVFEMRRPLSVVRVEPVRQDPAERARSRPPLDPAKLFDDLDDSNPSQPESMPGVPVSEIVLKGQITRSPMRVPPIGAVPQAALTIVRDEAGDEFLEGDFGAYAIKRVIARGRTSVVYLAVHRDSSREVALKVLEMPPVSAARLFTERGDELIAAAHLDSPHVVRTLDVGRVGEKYYVALQYVDGWTLEEMLDAGDRPSYVRVAEIGRDIATALLASEAHEIMHLDLRPDHVMIAESGQALLSGFGFAPGRDPRFPKVRGTPEYMAPEQRTGTPDHRSDLYGLGATLYRVLTGKVVFDPNAREPSMASSAPPPDPRETDPAIPEALAQIVIKLLQKRRDDRFQTAQEVLEQFEQLLFDVEAAGFQEAPAQAPPQLRPLLVQAALGSLMLVGVALVLTIALDAAELWSGRKAAKSGALFGMTGLIAASVLLSTIALIRRGQIPLPLSSAWLVRLQESCAVLSALSLVAGFVLAPPAVLNVMVGSIAIVVLMSGVFGTLLRRSIAHARADGGVGRMLAVLGDPLLGRWRAVHVPLIACLTALATARWALMSYFASA